MNTEWNPKDCILLLLWEKRKKLVNGPVNKMVRVPDGDQLAELHVSHHEVPLAEGVHAPVPLIGEPTLVILKHGVKILLTLI